LIDRSVRQGYVERQRDDADRRRVFIHLTDAGEAILRDLSVHHRAELRSAGPALVQALNALLGPGEALNGSRGSMPPAREATPDDG
jgi:DNA-binding MarR family transcriptional regulator